MTLLPLESTEDDIIERLGSSESKHTYIKALKILANLEHELL